MAVLSDDELDRLIPLLTERRFRAREFIFSSGDKADRVYLLLKGRVKVFQGADNGKEVILEVVGRGGILGDMAIVEDGERTATAQALEDSVALSISWQDFSHVVQQSPRLGFAMAELMARRLARMQRSFASLVAKPVSARLAEALLSRGGRGVVRLGLTHQELAQTIGTSRETVTALLSRFIVLGAITPCGNGYAVADPELLRAIAEGQVPVSPRHPAAPEPKAALP
jgi:CRP/FNR family transcriptional regulator